MENQEQKSTFNFGRALEEMETGAHVQREGWNGKGMYLFKIGTNPANPLTGGWDFTIPNSKEEPKEESLELQPFIALKTADNKVVPWLPSQTDMQADDWSTVWQP